MKRAVLIVIIALTLFALTTLIFAFGHLLLRREPFVGSGAMALKFGPQPTPQKEGILKRVGCFALTSVQHNLDEDRAPFYTTVIDGIEDMVALQTIVIEKLAALPSNRGPVYVLVAKQNKRIWARICCPSLTREGEATENLNFIGASHRYLYRFISSRVYETDNDAMCQSMCPNGPMARFLAKYPYKFQSETKTDENAGLGFSMRFFPQSSIFFMPNVQEALKQTNEQTCGYLFEKKPEYTDKNKPPPKDAYYAVYAVINDSNGYTLNLRTDIIYLGMELYPPMNFRDVKGNVSQANDTIITSANGKWTMYLDRDRGLIVGPLVISPLVNVEWSKVVFSKSGQLQLMYYDAEGKDVAAFTTPEVSNPGPLVLGDDGSLQMKRTATASDSTLDSLNAASNFMSSLKMSAFGQPFGTNIAGDTSRFEYEERGLTNAEIKRDNRFADIQRQIRDHETTNGVSESDIESESVLYKRFAVSQCQKNE